MTYDEPHKSIVQLGNKTRLPANKSLSVIHLWITATAIEQDNKVHEPLAVPLGNMLNVHRSCCIYTAFILRNVLGRKC